MLQYFALWDKKTRTVVVVQTDEVEVYCSPENNSVSIWNKRNQSCVAITIETWNAFARDEHRLPTHVEWQQFWAKQP